MNWNQKAFDACQDVYLDWKVNRVFRTIKKDTTMNATPDTLKLEDIKVDQKLEHQLVDKTWHPCSVIEISRHSGGRGYVMVKLERTGSCIATHEDEMSRVRLPQSKFPVGTRIEWYSPYALVWKPGVVTKSTADGYSNLKLDCGNPVDHSPDSSLRLERTPAEKQADAIKDAVAKVTKDLEARVKCLADQLNVANKKLASVRDLLR